MLPRKVWTLRETVSPVNMMELVADDGSLVLIPRAVYERLTKNNPDEIVLTIPLSAARIDRIGWLTVSEAAALLRRDFCGGLSTPNAITRVSRAASRGKFQCDGGGRARRIDPVSFDAWRLVIRDKENDDEDARIIRDRPRPGVGAGPEDFGGSDFD